MRVTDLRIQYRGLLRAEPQRRSAWIFSGGASRIGFRSAHMVGFGESTNACSISSSGQPEQIERGALKKRSLQIQFNNDAGQ
jgi:hypothetical protein